MSRRLPIAPAALTRRRLIGLLHAHAGGVALVLFLQLAAALASVALPWIVGDIIDGIRAGMGGAWVRQRLLLAVVFVIANFILAWWAETRARILGETVFARLRDGLVDSVVHLPLSTVETAGSGDLISRTTTDIDRVQMMIRQGLSTILILLMTIGVTLVAAFAAAPSLAWILPIEIIGVVGVSLWYMPRTIPAYRASAAMIAVFSGHLSETVTQAEAVDALRLGAGRHRTFDSMLAQMWRLERYGAWMRGFLFLGMVAVTLVPIAAMILLGAVSSPRAR